MSVKVGGSDDEGALIHLIGLQTKNCMPNSHFNRKSLREKHLEFGR